MDPHSLSSYLANATSFLPSPEDLLLAIPRLLSKAGSAAGALIAEPTAANATNATVATAVTASRAFAQESVQAAASAAAADPGRFDNMMQTLKHTAALFGYLTSKWAIATFASAILLNRTYFYASSRVPLSFRRLHIRILLYVMPTMLFLYRIRNLLRAMRCQTSPSWSELQYGAPERDLTVDFAGEGGFLWRASSALLFGEALETSCQAVNMLPPDPGHLRARGSLALLWPLFISLGLSQFVETLSCALQGVRPLQEVGMTIFEHSLAFAEAEAVVTKPFMSSSANFSKPVPMFTPDGTALSVSRTALSQFVNVPPEVLVISLISCFGHLTSNILAIVGLRAKFRLLTTTIWGMAYMSIFAWSMVNMTQNGAELSLVRIPSVCILGFIPHILIILGISACGVIYLLAFGLTVLSPPPGHPETMSWRERFSVAYANLHANIHLSSITPLTISWHEDFYTVILKIGFTILTAASEAVYLNEGTKINVNPITWLEKKRLQELLERRRRFQRSLVNVPRELTGNTMGEGIELVDEGGNDASNPISASGYARERKARGAAVDVGASGAVGRDAGVGLQQRRGRYHMTYQLLRGIVRLVSAIIANTMITILQKIRITYNPRWLRRVAGPRETVKPRRSAAVPAVHTTRQLVWTNRADRIQPLDGIDVEDFMRQNLRRDGIYNNLHPDEAEEYLNDRFYVWWKKGGDWGDTDHSGDYIPSQDDDATSVISDSQSTTGDRDDWSDISDGQRTPTQSHFSRSRESTPLPDDNTIDLSHLSHLLDPKTQEDREEARLLSRHLQSQGIMTRSQFRKQIESEEYKLLTSSRLPVRFDASMSPEDEEKLLEEFILGRRSATTNTHGASTAGTWDTGADGMGSEGPQCVVCQLSPRTVLVWPCGCLSLCDECRVGLASKNYTTCVCCRTNVVAYSRLYVP